MFCSHVKTFKFMAGRAPQHPLSRPSSICGVEDSFRFDVVQTFNNVQMNGWSCSPKHGRNHFTGLKNLFLWLVWSFSKTFELVAGPCSPKHGPVPFTVLKNVFVWMLCSHVKTFKFMAGPRSPTFFVTARLISSVEEPFCFDYVQTFNIVQMNGWVVLPQTRLSSVHGVEEFICVDVLQPCKNTQVYGWAALPNIPCHRPAYFAALKNRFVLWLCRLSTTFKWTDGRALPNTVKRISKFWRIFFLMMVSSF